MPWDHLIGDSQLDLVCLWGPGQLSMHISLEERGSCFCPSVGSQPRASPLHFHFEEGVECILLEGMLTIWLIQPCARDVWKQQRFRRNGRCVLISVREAVQMVGYQQTSVCPLGIRSTLSFKISLTFMISEPMPLMSFPMISFFFLFLSFKK